MKMITLKTGTVVPEPALVATLMNLELLMETSPIAFCELVTAARSGAPVSAQYWQVGVISTMLEEDGRVQNTSRAIVLACVTGEGAGMKLESPT